MTKPFSVFCVLFRSHTCLCDSRKQWKSITFCLFWYCFLKKSIIFAAPSRLERVCVTVTNSAGALPGEGENSV